MMRAVDALQSLPFVFVVIFVITLVAAWKAELEQGLGLSREVLLYVLVGAISWLTMARVVRGQVLALRRADFVLAARAAGASSCARAARAPRAERPGRRDRVPDALRASILLTEAFLSFLGLGIEAPRVSWGLLAADSAEAINRCACRGGSWSSRARPWAWSCSRSTCSATGCAMRSIRACGARGCVERAARGRRALRELRHARGELQAVDRASWSVEAARSWRGRRVGLGQVGQPAGAVRSAAAGERDGAPHELRRPASCLRSGRAGGARCAARTWRSCCRTRAAR
jgi:hypothetical protein